MDTFTQGVGGMGMEGFMGTLWFLKSGARKTKRVPTAAQTVIKGIIKRGEDNATR